MEKPQSGANTQKFTKNKIAAAAVAAVLLVLTVLEMCGISVYNTIYTLLGLKDKPIQVSGDVSVHYIDVGQGDCELIISSGETVLIDSGEKYNAENVAAYLESNGVEKIDYLIATHPHSDHIGSMAYIVENFDIGTVIMPELSPDIVPVTSCYINLLNAISEKDLQITLAELGDEYALEGGATLKILGPVGFADDLNNSSVVCMLIHGENSFLFTGDAEKSAEIAMLESDADLNADVLKVGHHGSAYSSCEDFLFAVSPRIAVISVGAANDYNHPSDDAIERLSVYTDDIYRTDLSGTIVIGSDGETLNIVTEK